MFFSTQIIDWKNNQHHDILFYFTIWNKKQINLFGYMPRALIDIGLALIFLFGDILFWIQQSWFKKK